MRAASWSVFLATGLAIAAVRGKAETMNDAGTPGPSALSSTQASDESSGAEVITLGGGCFWCIEAVFDELNGVRSVESGYSGGETPNPNYKQVCTGMTGHAEVVQITFDPHVLSLKDLLEVFFTIHDPTTTNRQGADVGTQYRSVIFYRNEAQKAAAEGAISAIREAKIWDRPIVTQIVPFEAFYKAEDYHQRYYEENPSAAYCRIVIEPKVQKFREHFQARLAQP